MGIAAVTNPERGLLLSGVSLGHGLTFVRRPSEHKTHATSASIPELEALLEADALDLAFERGVENLHALLRHLFGPEVATPGRLGARLGGWRRVLGGRRGVARRVACPRDRGVFIELCRERVELRLRLRELHL